VCLSSGFLILIEQLPSMFPYWEHCPQDGSWASSFYQIFSHPASIVVETALGIDVGNLLNPSRKDFQAVTL
jgi:hypothetical protein